MFLAVRSQGMWYEVQSEAVGWRQIVEDRESQDRDLSLNKPEPL